MDYNENILYTKATREKCNYHYFQVTQPKVIRIVGATCQHGIEYFFYFEWLLIWFVHADQRQMSNTTPHHPSGALPWEINSSCLSRMGDGQQTIFLGVNMKYIQHKESYQWHMARMSLIPVDQVTPWTASRIFVINLCVLRLPVWNTSILYFHVLWPWTQA